MSQKTVADAYPAGVQVTAANLKLLPVLKAADFTATLSYFVAEKVYGTEEDPKYVVKKKTVDPDNITRDLQEFIDHVRNGAALKVQVAPTVSVGSLTNTGATVSWGAVAGETGFYAEYKTHVASTWTRVGGGIIAANATSKAITGLTQNTSYDFRVITLFGIVETTSAVVTASTTNV